MDRTEYLKVIQEVVNKGPYQDSWESLSGYELPEWYRNAKFGIFIHWGVYSVPAFDNEWYPRNMYMQGSKAYEHHIKTYGNHKDFGYKDFIPMFTADKFNASEWAELFSAAGARYAVPVGEHHDGFQMYKSELSHFNAVEMGPKKDVLGALEQEFKKKNITFGTSSHRIEHWFFMGHGKEFDSDVKEPLECGDLYWPAMPEVNHAELFDNAPSEEFMEDWLLRTCEMVDLYHPKVLYFDWWIQHSALKPYLKKFAAYYYNRAAERGEQVVINYKYDAFMFGCAVVDMERGQFAEQKPYFWQTDTSVALNSWCHTENNEYKQPVDIICDLVDIVSKNGCLLLNVGPKADGSIPEEDRSILLEIGEWMRINGEGIYDSEIWRTAGEGPTKIEEGQFTDAKKKEFTSEDIRFTVKGTWLYAFVLKYPEDGRVSIKALGERSGSFLADFQGIIKDISVLGFEEKPVWTRDKEALHINTKNVSSDKPVCFKIQLD